MPMERVIAYMTSLDPAYPRTIEGASKDEIEELVEMSGPLPASYHAYLAKMGRSPGKLRVPYVDLGIDQALRFYREGAFRLPEACRFLGKHGNYPYADYYLDGRRASGPEPLVVQYSPEGTFTSPYGGDVYATLEEMLLSTAFTEIRMKALGRRVRTTPSGLVTRPHAAEEPMIAGFHRIAAQLGFSLVAGTGPWSPCYDRGDVAMRGYQPPPEQGMTVEVAASDPAEMSRTLEILGDNLGMAIP